MPCEKGTTLSCRGIVLVFFLAPRPLQDSKGTPSTGAFNTREWGNFANIAIYYGTLTGSNRSMCVSSSDLERWGVRGQNFLAYLHNYALVV